MIKYNYKYMLEKLKEVGYNTYRIRKENLIGEGTLQNMRDGGAMINLKAIDTICRLTGCRIEELIEYVPDDPEEIPGEKKVETETEL